VDTIEMSGNSLQVRRQTDVGFDRFEAKMPLVVTVTNNDRNVPRIPKTRDVMMSFRQPLTKWTVADLGLNIDEMRAGNSYYEVVELFIPVKETNCEFVDGDTVEERVDKLARRIIEVTSAM